MNLTLPDFCTTVSPDEYDYIGQYEDAVASANKFHKKTHPECPPPYYTFDYGKLYGLVKANAEKDAELAAIRKELDIKTLENIRGSNRLDEYRAAIASAADILRGFAMRGQEGDLKAAAEWLEKYGGLK